MKIETKHGLWKVIIEEGQYSDYDEEVIVIAANSAEETWDRVKWLYDRYQLPMRTNKTQTNTTSDGETWEDPGDLGKYLVSEEFGNYGNVNSGYSNDIDITICPLDIYYFNGKEDQ